MYPAPAKLGRYAAEPRTRPYIMCEYEHALGNGSGDLRSYWDQIYTKTNLQGGFIWDWVDQGLRQRQQALPMAHFTKVRPRDPTFWAYGGDFGPAGTPTDDNFCCNGLVTPDRKPHPGLYAVKHVYQYIQCKPLNLEPAREAETRRTVQVRNGYAFLNLKDFAEGTWRLKADGVELHRGALPDLDIEPQVTQDIEILVPAFRPEPGVEYVLELGFTLKKDLPWAQAGHEIAWDEFKLPDKAPAGLVKLRSMPKLRATDQESSILISGKDFEVRFDKHTGGLASWRFQGIELIRSPLRPDFWRAQTDNDRGRNMQKSQGVWQNAHQNVEVRRVALQSKSKSAVVKVVLGLPKVDSTWETCLLY